MLWLLSVKAVIALREPSLDLSLVSKAELLVAGTLRWSASDINLHFTGDSHAIVLTTYWRPHTTTSIMAMP